MPVSPYFKIRRVQRTPDIGDLPLDPPKLDYVYTATLDVVETEDDPHTTHPMAIHVTGSDGSALLRRCERAARAGYVRAKGLLVIDCAEAKGPPWSNESSNVTFCSHYLAAEEFHPLDGKGEYPLQEAALEACRNFEPFGKKEGVTPKLE